ncbi:MAG: hypothetical protein WB919_03425 [Candidatus Sulfotelmatobacter sp.]
MTLLFVDSCGRALEPSEVFVDHGGQTQVLPAAQGGTYALTGMEEGRLKLVSRSWRFRPDEVEVVDRMNQVHLFEATAVHAPMGSVEREEIVLEFAEKLREGEHGAFRILTIEGRLVETIHAGSEPARYYPAGGEPLMIQAVRNGAVLEQILHPGHKQP